MKAVELLLSAAAWSKEMLLEALAEVRSAEAARQLLSSACEPWTAAELLPILYAAAAEMWKEEVLCEVLKVEGAQFQVKALKQALALAAKAGNGAKLVDDLLNVFPRSCSHRVLTSAINSASNRRGNAVDSLLGRKKWTREQLWQLVGNAVSSKKHAVLKRCLWLVRGCLGMHPQGRAVQWCWCPLLQGHWHQQQQFKAAAVASRSR
jgi:hypothetical protein